MTLRSPRPHGHFILVIILTIILLIILILIIATINIIIILLNIIISTIIIIIKPSTSYACSSHQLDGLGRLGVVGKGGATPYSLDGGCNELQGRSWGTELADLNSVALNTVAEGRSPSRTLGGRLSTPDLPCSLDGVRWAPTGESANSQLSTLIDVLLPQRPQPQTS